MRLFLLLAAALSVNQVQSTEHLTQTTTGGTNFDLRDGFKDGTVLSFQFDHNGTFQFPEEVNLTFYDEFELLRVDEDNITATMRLERSFDYATEINSTHRDGHGWNVYHNTHDNGRSMDEPPQAEILQPLDFAPLSKGWWKLDIVKIDKYHMNVFFNGFWSGVRKFQKSLNNIKSISIESNYTIHDATIFWYKTPNNNVKAWSLNETQTFLSDKPYKSKELVTIKEFQVGSQIEMVAVMRASGEASRLKLKPALVFESTSEYGTYENFLTIIQFWGGSGANDSNYWQPTHSTNEMHLSTSEAITMLHQDRKNSDSTVCTDYNTKPNGDIVHLHVNRISTNVIKTTIVDKGISCQIEIPADRVHLMDKQFNIVSHQGAFIVHLESPESIEGRANPSAMIHEDNATPSLASILLPALAVLSVMILGL